MTQSLNSSVSKDARALIRFLSRNKKNYPSFLILTHDYPDPDALGSAFALQYIAEQVFQIPSKIVYRGDIRRVENKAMVNLLKLPISKLKPGDFKKYRHVALVDTQPEFENNPFSRNRQPAIIIDQHPSVKKPQAGLTIINEDCGATCVVLAEALLQLKVKIPSSLATSLVYGILSDTLNLFRTNTREILKAYLGILPYADLKALSMIQNPSRSRDTFTILGKGINRAMVRQKLIVSHLGPIKSPDLISQVADFLISYKGMQWALCSGRFKDKIFVSLRISNRRGNAGNILRGVFDDPRGAGGHDVIAGGSFKVKNPKEEESWTNAEDQLVQRLVRRLHLRSGKEFYYPFR